MVVVWVMILGLFAWGSDEVPSSSFLFFGRLGFSWFDEWGRFGLGGLVGFNNWNVFGLGD